MLHGDLRVIQTALSEVLSCVLPSVPSWKFPEKLSTDVSLDDLLTTVDSEDRVNLLEGIIDRQVFFYCLYYKQDSFNDCRLLLLLQTSLKLWDENSPLPLSLSSTVKKYCKQLLVIRKSRSNLQKQVHKYT